MLNEIWVKIVLCVVSFIVTGSCGYLSAKLNHYHQKLIDKEKNEEVQNQALLYMLQSQLTNIFFVYEQMGEIPDYVYRNWTNMSSIYKKLGGNDYIHILEDKMKNWRITKTDILK